MDQGTQKQIIFSFLTSHNLAVVATSLEDKPEAAVVEYSETGPLKMIFDTFSTYRKYENLKQNPRVACVIGWDEEITVQYEGKAEELFGDELIRCQKIHVAKIPSGKKFVTMPQIKYFKVKPTWIRYSDLSVNPWNVFEITF